MPATGDEGDQPAGIRRIAVAVHDDPSRTATAQSASAATSSAGDEHVEPLTGRGLGHLGRQLQQRRRRVGSFPGHGSDVLDGDAVDGVDLLGQQLDRHGVGEGDDELVDHPSAASLEDVDRRDVAVDGPDAAGHLTERARAGPAARRARRACGRSPSGR